jgi:signal transduction histidine kinase
VLGPDDRRRHDVPHASVGAGAPKSVRDFGEELGRRRLLGRPGVDVDRDLDGLERGGQALVTEQQDDFGHARGASAGRGFRGAAGAVLRPDRSTDAARDGTVLTKEVLRTRTLCSAPPDWPPGGLPDGSAVSAVRRRVLALAAAYYAAGRASLALQYDGPVAAIWLPVGVGAAALYLAGLRWWPGLLIGDVALADPAQPLASALGLTAGNMADILAIAVLLRLLLGQRAALDRLEQVGGMLVAIAAGAVTTATVATLSLRAGGVVESSELPTFWRSWFLADASGALVIMPLALAWAQPRSRAWRAGGVWEGALVIAAVVALSAIALSEQLPLTYLVFPALIWAALRFGQRGATLALAVAAGMTVGLTANEVGAFVEHSITARALSMQLYMAVAALTTLCLAAIVSERRRGALDLVESRARIAAAAAEERRRLERELHDSAQNRLVGLQIRLGLAKERTEQSAPELATILTRLVKEAEGLGEELRRIAHGISPPLLATRGLVDALRNECLNSGIAVQIAARDIGLSEPDVDTAVYLCCLESIQNAVKHAGSDAAVAVRLRRAGNDLAFSVHDTGGGFDTRATAWGAGLTGVQDRIETVGGRVKITAAPGSGTTVAGVVPWPQRAA